jgi:predicted dinucleotide-binding enzyme
MRIGVLGTGVVGRGIASKLVELGHEVRLGSRDAAHPGAAEWAAAAGDRASNGTFADAAALGEIVFNCTGGAVSLEALEQAGEDALRGKVLVDVSNPLDFSRGRPPSLTVPSTDSVAEQIQRRFPETRVVKALNTINADVMTDPRQLPGEHEVFVCGDDEGAKDDVRSLLERFGWPREAIVDFGALTAARGLEAYVLFWVNLMGAVGHPRFNIHVVR